MKKKLLLMFGMGALVAFAAWGADIYLGGKTKITAMHPTTNGFLALMGDHTLALYRFIPPSNVVEVLKTMPNFPLNTSNVVNDAITYAKIQNVTTARLLGRATGGSGDTEEITLGTGLSFGGTTLNVDAVPAARAITIAGTASEITSSAGAQDLSADRTWTLSLPATIDLGGKTSFELPNGAAPVTDVAGEIAVDTTITDHTPLIQYFGAAEMLVIAIPRAQLTSTDGHVIKYNAASDRFEMGAVAGSGDFVGPASSTDNAVVRFDGTTGKLGQNSGVIINDTNGVSIPGGVAAHEGLFTNSVTAASFIGQGSGAGAITLYDTAATEFIGWLAPGDVTTSYRFQPPAAIASAGFLRAGVTASSISTVTVAEPTITVAGTASEITSSAGAQDLSANRTWTLSLPATIDLGGKTSFELPNGAAPVTDVDGELALDTTITDHKGMLQYYSGATEMLVLAVPRAQLTTTDAQMVIYNAATDDLRFVTPGAGSVTWDGIGDATVPGSVSFAGHEQDIVSTLDSGDILTITDTDADVAADTVMLKLAFNDGADVNAFYESFINDADGTPTSVWSVSQTAFVTSLASAFAGTISVSDTVSLGDGVVTNNVKYITSELVPQSNLTNYTADFKFAWGQKPLTNHLHISAVSNVPTDGGKGWMATIRNFSGTTYTVSLDTTIPRNGTNFVAVANAKKAIINLVTDGSGGSNITNLIGSITLADSP